ncbi:transcription initiation protein [Nocardioides sp. LMS-CY]|uniref:YciI family protein n=1 Tax=Nocardioides sp. (strain LMS-CY) TaxID=2840457 RepID=UPI001C008055|nr:YciI family protein [Nocardioides sp. LMS-CY]QWF24026.1 transcription initiation protein [Nocardioides sp. LMS-CY]
MSAERRRYLLLLPAPEEEWARLPESEHELGMENHRRFHEALAARGHELVLTSPLEPSSEAISMRNTGRGSVVVTDGPFTETVEQIVGFYLVESADEQDLIEIVRAFAEGGDHVELRRLASGA